MIATGSRKLNAIAIAIALATGTALVDRPALAQTPVDTARQYRIPAGKLADGLKQLGIQGALQLLAPPELTASLKGKEVLGTYTSRQALDTLLAGSGLVYEFVNANTVVIKKAASPSSSESSQPSGSIDGRGAGRGTPPNPATLEAMVVTAQKRSEDVFDVPMSVAALGAEDLDQLGARDIDDLARLVPGISNTATSSYGGSTLSIRGINANTGASTTGVYINDTPVQTRNYLGVVNNSYPKIFDLDRVEVLRGPQGTLFGSSSEGGAIRFITPTPSLTETSTYVRSDAAVTEGGAPSGEIGAAVGGPLVEDVLGGRISVWRSHVGGYVDRVDRETGGVTDRDTNSKDDWAMQGALRWAVSDALEISPSIFWQKSKRNDIDLYWPGAGEARSWYGMSQPEEDRFVLPSLVVDYHMDSADFKAITSYYDRRDTRVEDYAPLSVASLTGGAQTYVDGVDFWQKSTTVTRQKNWTQEFRLASRDETDGRLSWVTGAFFGFERQTYDQVEVDNIGDLIPVLFPDYTLETFYGRGQLPGNVSYLQHLQYKQSEKALYGELSYLLTPRLKATVGLRASHTKFYFTDMQDGPLVGSEQLNYSGGQSEDPITPRLNLSYQGDQQLLYVSAAKGYRIGGANSQVPTTCASDLAELNMSSVPDSYGSDTVWSYETGLKRKLFSGRVEFSGALFWVDWDNIQVNIPLDTCGFGFNANLGKAVSKGFDFQWRANPLSGLLLNAAVSYTHTEYRKTITGTTASTILAKRGDDLNTPEWQGSLSADYSWQLASGNYAYVHGDYQYTGSYHRTNSYGVNGYNPWTRDAAPISLAGLRLGYRRGDADWSLYVENLLDNDELVYYYRAEAAGAADARAARLRPRTIGVSFTLRR